MKAKNPTHTRDWERKGWTFQAAYKIPGDKWGEFWGAFIEHVTYDW